MKQIRSISELIPDYDGFIIDLWGVMHDGTQMYPGAHKALEAIHAAHKPAVFLSNAPRPHARAEESLTRLQVPKHLYKTVVCSGGVAREVLNSTHAYGKKYFYLGPGKDEDVLDGLDFEQTSLEHADFVICAGYAYDFQPHEEIIPLLEHIAQFGLPFVCINPDLEVVKQDGTHMLCAGMVAKAYEDLGHKVFYYGKPHQAVYDAVRGYFPQGSKLLCIGDNLLTDIRGANAEGLDSLLITGGVLYTMNQNQHPKPAELKKLSKEADATPTFVAELFTD